MSKSRKEIAIAGVAATRKRPVSHCALASVLLALALIVPGAAGNRRSEDCDIWFVHATDPHLFLKAIQADGKTDAKIKEEQGKKRRQEELNEKALTDMLKHIRSLPGGEGPSAFLVLTGDLGIDPCEICKTAAQPGMRTLAECLDADPANQIKETARILGDNPVPNIYLVAGNNDIANESAGDEALKYFNDFIDAVQAKLGSDKVKLHNLTRGYLSGEAQAACYADIPHTDYRLIGFPSYSFKAGDPGQERHMKIFRDLVEDAGKAGKKVLVVSHTPGMDDPYNLAQSRYANPTPTPTPTAAATAKKAGATPETTTDTENKPSDVSTWKVSDKVRGEWEKVVDSDSVAAVLAGHLHDSHKEIYRPPYVWSNGSEHRAAFQKLFLAPPLAVKNQDNSPIQARGFSLVHLQSDCVASQLFWYDSETRKFIPDPQHKHRWGYGGFWCCLCQGSRAAIWWLWDLEKTDSALVRMAVLLIAFLTAFLTIVAIWQIPAADDPFAEGKKTEGASKPAQAASKASADTLPFANRFGKTVIAGLGGLLAAEVTKTLGNAQPSADTRWYYIVWFILSFFFLLFSLNFLRALAEAVRARIAVVYYPLALARPIWRTLRYWFVSLRVPLLTAFDTFINLIQGKNQTITRVFAERVIDQQRIVISVADAIRADLHELIEWRVRQTLLAKAAAAQARGEKGVELVPSPGMPNLVRVNISVLSADQASVFYISRAPGSSHSSFPIKSVAWISVFTGEIRWFKSAYRGLSNYEDIILFKNDPPVIPGEKSAILLKPYYQPRKEDYKAFVIFPVPWPRRGFGGDYVKGAIHISFSEDPHFEYIWKAEAMDEKGKPPTYSKPERMLEDWCDPEIRAALRNSIAVLGELLRGFNEETYRNYIEGKPAG